MRNYDYFGKKKHAPVKSNVFPLVHSCSSPPQPKRKLDLFTLELLVLSNLPGGIHLQNGKEHPHRDGLAPG